MADATYTIVDAMVACGVDNAVRFNGNTAAERIAAEVFDDDFMSCIDKDISDLEDDFKTYSVLTVNQGQIRLRPGIKRKIRGFIQWAKDQLRTGGDPSSVEFPVDSTVELIRRHKSHVAFCEKSQRVSETAKPQQFTEKTKWLDWAPVFINFLKCLPGRHGIPLVYVIRENDDAIIDATADMLTDYVNRAPLDGEAFDADASEVHTYIVNFIAGNEAAESKILANADRNNGRLDFKALQEHYEGVGINALAIRDADNIIETLQYTGERKPTMWWDEFERKLTMAFNIYDKKERREVYSDEMKLRILCRKVNADFLDSTRQLVNLDLTRTPVTMTYAQALASFRNEVNRKFPPNISATERTRRMAEIDSQYNRGRGGRGRGRGRGGTGGRGRGRGYNRQNNKYRREGVRSVEGLDGRQMEVHPAFNFNDDDWYNLPDEERQRISNERKEYNSRKRQRIAETHTKQEEDKNGDHAHATSSHYSGNIMGGRNEQEAKRATGRKQS